MKIDEIKKELLKLKKVYSALLKSNKEDLKELKSDFCKGLARGEIIAYRDVLSDLQNILDRIY